MEFNPIIATERQQTINGVQGRYTGATMRHDEKPGCFCKQTWVASRKISGHESIHVEIRYDDSCRNGHNSFAITGELRDTKHGNRRNNYITACGCIHEDIAKYLPELEPLIKWHLFDSTRPMHYLANTLYHAGNRDHWGLLKGEFRQHTSRGVHQNNGKEGVPCWTLAQPTAPKEVYSNEKPAPIVLEYVPVGITGEQLSLPREELKALLEARLPALLLEFRAAVESCGFLFERE